MVKCEIKDNDPLLTVVYLLLCEISVCKNYLFLVFKSILTEKMLSADCVCITFRLTGVIIKPAITASWHAQTLERVVFPDKSVML